MRPPVLLLDEPLAALDLKLRQAMQEELRRIHSDIGGTFVFVTHDQGEAMSLANRLGVMHQGEMIQVGSPRMFTGDRKAPSWRLSWATQIFSRAIAGREWSPWKRARAFARRAGVVGDGGGAP